MWAAEYYTWAPWLLQCSHLTLTGLPCQALSPRCNVCWDAACPAGYAVCGLLGKHVLGGSPVRGRFHRAAAVHEQAGWLHGVCGAETSAGRCLLHTCQPAMRVESAVAARDSTTHARCCLCPAAEGTAPSGTAVWR